MVTGTYMYGLQRGLYGLKPYGLQNPMGYRNLWVTEPYGLQNPMGYRTLWVTGIQKYSVSLVVQYLTFNSKKSHFLKMIP